MATAVMPVADEVIETARSLHTPPRGWEEEIKVLAFKLWQRGSCPETENDQDWVEAETWCHGNSL